MSSYKLVKNISPKKLTENEKATLLEVFTLSNEKLPTKMMVRSRSKSPIIRENLE